MIAQELRHLQEALTRRANDAQREFNSITDALKTLGRRLQEAPPAEHAPLLAEREALHARQAALADEINLWRERARAVLRQPNDEALRSFLAEMGGLPDEDVRAAVERARFILDASEEELAKLAAQRVARSSTPAGRLIERARTDYDLRGAEPKPRREAAVEFANRPGMIQDDAVLAELEAAMSDADPLVSGLVTETVIQLHRIRATRSAELSIAEASVRRLREIQNPAVIPVFIEVLSHPRTGFVPGEQGLGLVSGTNSHARRLALSALVEWHTPEAQRAVRAVQFDRDSQLAKRAGLALERFPGEWKGPTPESRRPLPSETEPLQRSQ
jgi:FtsZ-binding cell division protein ZapB